MDEPEETPLSPEVVARRLRAADSIERRLRLLVPLSLLLCPGMIAVGVTDLANRWLSVSRRLDVLFIIVGVSTLYEPLRLRRTARRLRTIRTRCPTTKTQAAKAIASILASDVAVFVVGYLLGGWLVAVLLTSALLVVTAALSLRTWLRIRRRQAV